MATEPPASPTQDTASHDTSPVAAAAPQKPLTPIKPALAREITGTIYNPKLPGHYLKHPNPVGRPKAPRG